MRIELSEVSSVSELDPTRHFKTDHLRGDLARRTLSGGLVSVGSQGLSFVMQLGFIAVLARLLTPADFGLVAMVTAVVRLFGLLRDMGLSAATVQREKLDHDQVSTLFWINVAFSLGLSALLIALSPAIASFYADERLASVTVVLAIGIAFVGAAAQHEALLKRQMRFQTIAAIRISAQALASLVAVGLALRGAGYWSLVALAFATQFFAAAGQCIASGWKPGRPRRDANIRSMLTFGGNLTAFNFINYFARNLDNVLIGRFVGAEALGFYSRAYNLLMMPVRQFNTPMTGVVVPALSRLTREPHRFRDFYCQSMLSVTAVGMPAVVFALVVAEELVAIVLGDQWGETVAIFRALGLAAFIGTLNVAVNWVLIPHGRADRMLIVSIPSTVAIVIAMIIGLQWGAIGVAWAYSIVLCFDRVPIFLYCFRGMPVKLGDLAGAIWRPAFCSITSGVLVWWIGGHTLTDSAPVPRVLAFALVYGCLYLLVWIVVPGGRTKLIEMVGGLRQAFTGRRPA